MPILHSFEENKLEYEDEDEVEIKMMGTGMDKKSLEHNLYEDDITPIICHNFSPTSKSTHQTKGFRLYLMRRSLEILRKFHWTILRGQFNVSSPLLSKPGEY
ncbi:hypothetical protein Tco_0520697 [Tanacetum coccineum]